MITFDLSQITAEETAALEAGMRQRQRTNPEVDTITKYLTYRVHDDVIGNLLPYVEAEQTEVIIAKYKEATVEDRARIITEITKIVPDKLVEVEAVVEG